MLDTGRAVSLTASLETLDDEALHAVMTRAQTLLLDRPASSRDAPILMVDVVRPEEGALLAAYRALPSPARRRLLARARTLVG